VFNKIVFFGPPLLEEAVAVFSENKNLPFYVDISLKTPELNRFSIFTGEDDPVFIKGELLKSFGIWSDNVPGVRMPCSFFIRKVRGVRKTSWKRFFHGRNIGEKFYIFPPWEQPTAEKGRIMLTIDAGAEFGTGHHPTTSLCIEYMEKVLTIGDKVLDAGCGSGVLSIAAAALGASVTTGFDIDPASVKQSQKNVELNATTSTCHFFCGDLNVIDIQKYDLLLVNILPSIFLPFAKDFQKYMHQNSTIIFSGIMEEQQDEIRKKLVHMGYTSKDTLSAQGWVAFRLLK